MEQSIPLACQDWTNTKAAYRFLSNRRVDEGPMLAGHFLVTRDRASAVSGQMLVLHDTTGFTYYGALAQASAQVLGMLNRSFKGGGQEQYCVRGILMCSRPAVTTE